MNHLYRMRKDGSRREQVASYPIATLQTASPDGRWVVAILPQRKSFLVPTDGGPPAPVCGKACYVQWAPDGRFFYVAALGSDQTLVVPLPPGETIPRLPAEGIRSVADPTLVPGSTLLSVEEIIPGSDPATYAYVKPAVQRNLFRISLR